MSKSGFTSLCIFTVTLFLLCSMPSHAQWVQRGSVLSSVTAGSSVFGKSVGISTDGQTLFIGGTDGGFAKIGSAWPFTLSGVGYGGTGFTQVNNDMTGSGNVGDSEQGFSVGISSNGQVAVVGGSFDNSVQGAFWIYTFNGTSFVQFGNKLVGTGNVGAARQGWSASISGDGKTIAIGGTDDNSFIGATWIFTFDGSNFVQFGNKLVGTGSVGFSDQGSSVSISTDGKTLAVGGLGDNNMGAAWIFTFNGSNFVQVGNKLVGTGVEGSIGSGMGSSISISGDGKTAIIGGRYDNNRIGAAWIYTFDGVNFVQLGSKLVGSGSIGTTPYQGWSVAISSDGKSAVVGGPYDNGYTGAIWTYIYNGNTFVEVSKISSAGSGYQGQGASVSISGDGKTIISGAPVDNVAYVYYNPNPPCFYPTVTGISTFSGICEGSNPVLTITAKGLPSPLAYQWYKDNNSITGANDSTLALTNVSISVSGIYTCRVSNVCGSTTSDGINLMVTPVSTLTGNVLPGPVCPGNQVTITGSGSSDIFVSSGLPFNSGFVPSVSGIYTLQDTTNICVLPAVVTVTVKNLPSLTISGNNPICPRGTSVLNVSGANDYLWSTGSTLSGISVSPLTVTSYVVTGTGLNSCTTIASIVVTVTGPVSIPINGSASVCTGDSIRLSVSHITKVKWSTGDTTAAIALLPNSNFILTLSGITDQGCKGEGSVSLIVTGPVSVPVNGKASVCIGDSIHLTVSHMIKIKWSTGDTTAAIALLPVVNSLLTLSGITDQGCQGEGFVNLTVNSLPMVNLDISQVNHLCNTVGSVALSGGKPSEGIYLYNGAIVSKLNINQPGDYPLVYQYKDRNACVNTATGILTVMLCTVPGPCDIINPPCTCPGYTCPPRLKIYNAFSPNNDNVNETWIIDSLPEQNQVMIIDKWGNEVFKAAPYHNDWDGKKDDKDLPAGIYYYLLEIEQKRKFSGTVSIIR